MGYIKEPKGVDFVIKSKSLTDLERTEISDFIKSRKDSIKMIKDKGRILLSDYIKKRNLKNIDQIG